ncbi:hypothetical protein EDEG_00978 [Edhazardia aedis USNM 41457]|uniref:Uncharacterized protein n=1 Tax=Edhazardia aedis (strain USNM 41457) TaxID=1003232 RepID=J9DAQ2_EDHAE|nr:hypothetical protein EDEG_00978 [Edhazardia aedis USNM 41457]|eukprot:EJW04841.1 hypothetical protein EDEG_00978 [Edhazardia aedis USNM 41457]
MLRIMRRVALIMNDRLIQENSLVSNDSLYLKDGNNVEDNNEYDFPKYNLSLKIETKSVELSSCDLNVLKGNFKCPSPIKYEHVFNIMEFNIEVGILMLYYYYF